MWVFAKFGFQKRILKFLIFEPPPKHPKIYFKIWAVDIFRGEEGLTTWKITKLPGPETIQEAGIFVRLGAPL